MLLSDKGRHNMSARFSLPRSSKLIALALCAFAIYSIHVHGQAFKPANVVDGIDAAVFLENFKEGAQLAGLLDILASPDFEGTVFAPTDLGFEAFLSRQRITKEQLFSTEKEAFKEFIALHIVPDKKLFPMSTLTQDLQLQTMASEKSKLYVDRSVPSLVHIWAVPKDAREQSPTNFATILQFQEIQGGKAVLYTIDNPLVPPPMKAALMSAPRAEALSGP